MARPGANAAWQILVNARKRWIAPVCCIFWHVPRCRGGEPGRPLRAQRRAFLQLCTRSPARIGAACSPEGRPVLDVRECPERDWAVCGTCPDPADGRGGPPRPSALRTSLEDKHHATHRPARQYHSAQHCDGSRVGFPVVQGPPVFAT
jgi:hypothetical protein